MFAEQVPELLPQVIGGSAPKHHLHGQGIKVRVHHLVGSLGVGSDVSKLLTDTNSTLCRNPTIYGYCRYEGKG